MKTPNTQQTPRRRLLAALGINLALAASLTLTQAADRTWDGGGDGVSMTNALNWAGDIAPVVNDSLFFGGAVGLTPNNDFAANLAFGITFNADAGAYVISGNEIDLFNTAITNNSANPQTISAPIENVGGNRFHNAATADLIYTGQVKGNRINKEGPNALWLMGTLDNSNLGLNLTNGSVILAKQSVANVRALGGGILVNTNGTLRVYGPGTDQIQFGQKVTMNGGLFQVANTNGLVAPSSEEINGLTGVNPTSIVENGLADSTNTLTLGGGFGGARGIYGGILRDGAGVFNFTVHRHNNIFVCNGTHTYSGTTTVLVNNDSGTSRLILNGTHVGGSNYTISANLNTRAAALGGTGIISATVANFNDNSLLSPGGSLASDANNSVFSETAGILTISNAVNLNTATATLDVQLNGTTVGSGYDQVNIAGSGSFSNNSANLKLTLGFTPATGDKFTIVKVQGTDPTNNVGIFATFNGVPTDLSQGATIVDPGTGKQLRISYRAEGSTFDAGEGLGNDIMLEVVAPVGAANLTWRGNGTDNFWDVTTTANWFNGTSLVTFNNGDFVTFDNSGSNNAPLDITTSVTPATFLFDATKDYVLAGAGKLTGTVVMTKTNTGKLTIVTDNDNLGTTIIQQGTVQVGTNGFTGTISGSVAVNAGGTLIHSRSDDVTVNTAITGTGTLLHTGDGALILGGDSTFSGKTTNSGGLLQLGTGVGIAGSINGDIHISSASALRYLYSGDVTIGHTKSGNGTVIYEAATGNRTFLIPASVVNTNYSGSNYVAAGVRLKNTDPSPAGYSLGNGGSVTVADFGQVYLESSPVPNNQEFFLQGNGWTGDATPLGALRLYQSTISGPIHLLADTRIGGFINGGTIIGKIDGAFQLEVLATATNFTLNLGPTNGPNTYASTLVTSGSIRALNSGGISSGPLTVDLIGVVHTFGNNVTVASLNNGGSGGGAIYNMSTTTNGTLTVGTDNSSTSFDGFFANGASQPLGLTKVGTGMLTLSGVNTSTGIVAVNGGTLALTGSGSFGNAALITVGSAAFYDVTATGLPLTLNSGQTLGGNGTVTGDVVTSAGSTIAPGTSVGTLTVAGNVTLGGGMTMELNRSLSPNSDRLLTSGGSITGGGTLTTTNIGSALQVGDTFQLFASGVSGITANLQTVDALNGVTYTWQNNIASSGSITVLSVTAIAPPTLGVVQAGNNLTFSWTGPFKLQSQTNSLNVGISSNWGDYPGGSTSPVNVIINPANPTVFFRLSLQ